MNKNNRAYTVDDVVLCCIRKYPELYKSRVQVLRSLFLMIGTGEEWHKGRIESPKGAPIISSPYETIKRLREELSENIGKYPMFINDYLNENKVLEDTVNNAIKISKNKKVNFKALDEDIFHPRNIVKLIKPEADWVKWNFGYIYKESPICNLPDDIKPSWLEAARELLDILWHNQDRIMSGKEYLPEIENRLQNLEEKHRRLMKRRENLIDLRDRLNVGKPGRTRWPKITSPSDKEKRSKSEKDGNLQYFKNIVKISFQDSIAGFYSRRLAPFTCLVNNGATFFTLSSIDDSWYTAKFNRVLLKPEATSLCREFIRTIPHRGLWVKDFIKFFQDHGANGWDIQGSFKDDNKIFKQL